MSDQSQPAVVRIHLIGGEVVEHTIPAAEVEAFVAKASDVLRSAQPGDEAVLELHGGGRRMLIPASRVLYVDAPDFR